MYIFLFSDKERNKNANSYNLKVLSFICFALLCKLTLDPKSLEIEILNHSFDLKPVSVDVTTRQQNIFTAWFLFHSIGICCLVWQIYYTKLQDVILKVNKYYVLTFQMLLDMNYCRLKKSFFHTHQTELNISNSNLLIKYLYFAVCEISLFVFFSLKDEVCIFFTLIFMFKPGIYPPFPFWHHTCLYTVCIMFGS